MEAVSFVLVSLFAMQTSSSPSTSPSSSSSTSSSSESSSSESSSTSTLPTPTWTLHGEIEGYVQWNGNEPKNGLTAFRGFDNRHNTLTLSNVVVDGEAKAGAATAHLALQTGATGATYFLAEPSLAGSGSVSASDAALWRNVQQGWLAYQLPVLQGLTLQGGLFLSPIGPEGILVKDNWNFSRSNLFFALPFYHTGARAALAVTPELTTTLALYNGWNSVVDNNQSKSISAQLQYVKQGDIAASLLYFGGCERGDDAAEGFAWRHLVDAHATWTPVSWLGLQAHADVGAEPNAFGVSSWQAAAVAARVQGGILAAALRVDAFAEYVPTGAAPIFWGVAGTDDSDSDGGPTVWVSSTTLTFEVAPVAGVALRLEERGDFASAPLFFGVDDPVGDVDGSQRQQFTTTLGAVAWF